MKKLIKYIVFILVTVLYAAMVNLKFKNTSENNIQIANWRS